MALYPLLRRNKLVLYYNVISTTLWGCCFVRFLILLPLVGRLFLPGGIADFFHVVSVLPLVGALLGLANGQKQIAGLLSGARMVWVCYGVVFPHPRVAKHTSYSLVITGWCIQNIVDSFYYAFRTKTRALPAWLFWLHHHHFYLLFPLSYFGEWILTFLAVDHDSTWFGYVLQAAVVAYVPFGYFAVRYFIDRRQRRYTEYMEKKQ